MSGAPAVGYTYIVGSKDDIVKIGHSRNLRSRFTALQMAHGNTLTILAIFLDKRLEEKLHKKFSHLCIRGEWYTCADELKQYVESFHFEPMSIDNFREQKYYCYRFLKEILIISDKNKRYQF